LHNLVSPLLNVDELVTGYGKKQVLNGITLEVASGEIIALLGHNGSGKSTLLKAIFGLVPIWSGRIFLDGQLLDFPKPRTLRHKGIIYVPQGSRVFKDLTILENLEMGRVAISRNKSLKEAIDQVLNLFPDLKPRLHHKAANLSGGQKQILALAAAMLFSPRLLLLDEPSLGLAPPIFALTLERIQAINRESGVSILIIEQKVREVLKIAKRVYALKNGKVFYSGVKEVFDEAKLHEIYF
jgi:branched-chain amino acid transport system ATP-binding protein